MARFHDTLAELLAGEGVAVPEGFGDTLGAAYDEDILASAAESNTIIAARDKMIQDLKAAAAISTITDPEKESFEDPDDPDAEVEADFDDFFTDEDPDNK